MKKSINRAVVIEVFNAATNTRWNRMGMIESGFMKAGDRYAKAEPADASKYTGVAVANSRWRDLDAGACAFKVGRSSARSQ
jgi:hypothetical protein